MPRNRKKLLKGNGGFTLVELMIGVAIIGILASIAIPNFMNFRLKSIRSEASVLLGSVYNAEISFYATHNYFSVSLYQIGIDFTHEPTVNNLQCRQGAALGCGKYYAVYVPYSSSTRFIALAEGLPDPSIPNGYDQYLVSWP